MSIGAPSADKYPFYRLFNEGQKWWVDEVVAPVDTECPHYDPEDSWTHTVKCRRIAVTNGIDGAFAALRLVGAEYYQDWTTNKGWSSPFVRVTPHDPTRK
jgi:hypothetical protein